MKNIFASTIFFIFVDELCNKHKRFGEMAAGMTAQAVLIWETVSDSSSGVQLSPPLRQAAPTLSASSGSGIMKRNVLLNKILTVRKGIKL